MRIILDMLKDDPAHAAVLWKYCSGHDDVSEGKYCPGHHGL